MSAGRLAEVLGAHHLLRYIEGFGYRCACGVGFSHLWLHADHLAAVVADWLRSDEARQALSDLRTELAAIVENLRCEFNQTSDCEETCCVSGQLHALLARHPETPAVEPS